MNKASGRGQTVTGRPLVRDLPFVALMVAVMAGLAWDAPSPWPVVAGSVVGLVVGGGLEAVRLVLRRRGFERFPTLLIVGVAALVLALATMLWEVGISVFGMGAVGGLLVRNRQVDPRA